MGGLLGLVDVECRKDAGTTCVVLLSASPGRPGRLVENPAGADGFLVVEPLTGQVDLKTANLSARLRVRRALTLTTAEFVARFFFSGANTAAISTGTNWPDALSAGAFMGTVFGPVILTPPTSVPADVASLLSAHSGEYSQALIFGGTGAISNGVATKVGSVIGGPVAPTFVTISPSNMGTAGTSSRLFGGTSAVRHRGALALAQSSATFAGFGHR